ncbi:MAG TPA: SRPBCC family protein [Actinomycetota bacterium]|jgi:uncharacterized membrane protein
MTIVEASLEIGAPPKEVWKVVSDPRNLPMWNRHIVDVKNAPEDGLRTGSRYTTTVGFMGVRAGIACEAIEVRAPEYAEIRLHGLLDAVVETRLRALSGDRTLLRHHVEYRFVGGPVGDLAASVVQMFGAGTLLRRGMQAQKRQAEDANGASPGG